MGNHNLKAIIKEGTVENVKSYLKEEPEMKNHVFRYGWTACHLAVEYHKLDILKYLLEEAEADFHHVDNAGSNLLHHALHHAEKNFDVVLYLLESGKFKFDDAKDEHGNTTLHLAFKYCTLKEIAELNKYYKGLKTLFQMKNDHELTPLAILKERCKNRPESLAIVKQLQEEIEGSSDSPQGSRHNSDEEKGGSKRQKHHKKSDEDKHSDDVGKGSEKKHSHKKGDHHEEEEDKKHSDDEGKGSKKHSHKHHKKDDHSDEEKGSKKHHKKDDDHSDEEKGSKKHHKKDKKHHHEEEEEHGKKDKHKKGSDDEKSE